MKRLIGFWKIHFLGCEFFLATSVSIISFMYLWKWDGVLKILSFIGNNRGLYASSAVSLFGALLGFSITATSIILGFSASERLAVLKESKHYPQIWRTLISTVKAFLFVTIVSIWLLVCEYSIPFVLSLQYSVFLLGILLSAFRLFRTIWILEMIIKIVTKK